MLAPHLGTRRKVHKISLTDSSGQTLNLVGLSSMNFCAENMCVGGWSGCEYNSTSGELVEN